VLDKSLFLLYFEKDCPAERLLSVRQSSEYQLIWFDPRNGTWMDGGIHTSSAVESTGLPEKPTTSDWALKLKLIDQDE
jgi:hypothetical protein